MYFIFLATQGYKFKSELVKIDLLLDLWLPTVLKALAFCQTKEFVSHFNSFSTFSIQILEKSFGYNLPTKCWILGKSVFVFSCSQAIFIFTRKKCPFLFVLFRKKIDLSNLLLFFKYETSKGFSAIEKSTTNKVPEHRGLSYLVGL